MEKLVSCQLGDLIEFQRGYDLPRSEFVEGEYPVQSSNGILGYHNEYKVIAPGITIGRSGTVGIPHLLRKNFFPHNTALFVKDFKGNDVEYIYYLLRYLDLGNRKSGSGVPTMNRNHLHPLKIKAYRDLIKQQKIANILSTLDRKIALNQQINQKLEAMAKQLYDYWFVQFDFPDENGKPYKSSGGEMVWCEVWKRDVPKGWRTANLAELIELKTGKEDANFSSENGQYPFFTCSEQVSKCAQYAFDERTILLAGNGSFSVKKFQGKFNAYQRTYLITPFDEKLYMPIYFVVKDSIRNFISGSRGSIIKFITKGDIENLKITIPLNGNLGFAKILLVFFEKQQLLDSETQKLTQLRDVLLPMLMNGQIFVE
ncbi:restriction endonuclease subunit S [Pasteurella caecimuris]|uniref:restriction endonuclease subunit S n=1 Tax=Rodentibacter caecimuris TaxID=1796644 RepID=UPI00214F673F|nr:restriction endonuclease subunit S [Pasteurella caecimuris]MCR1836472.1 restriction endonuclease subunit S [Pasteurella caecimuris]MCU0105778.1 restriction endonuclease subunit S [Pasteurella caecimuris]